MALALVTPVQLNDHAGRASPTGVSAPAREAPVTARPIAAAPPTRPDSAGDSLRPAPALQVGADSAPAAVGPPPSAQTPSRAVNPPPVSEPRPAEARWTRDWTNVRARPGNDAPIIRVLPPATEVTGTRDRWGWWAVRLGGDTVGYIAGALLRSDRPRDH